MVKQILTNNGSESALVSNGASWQAFNYNDGPLIELTGLLVNG